jgi:nitrate reductase assembly molybdenum cofactor insertion protein NarJ
MKNFVLCSILLVFSYSAFAKDKNEISPEQAKVIHNELRALLNTVQDAFNKLDIETIYENLDENIIFSTMNSDVVHGRDKLR